MPQAKDPQAVAVSDLKGALQNDLLNKFRDEINKDTPAIFIYSPYFIYIYPNQIKNVEFGEITISGERFININKWFIETNKVWKIFAK